MQSPGKQIYALALSTAVNGELSPKQHYVNMTSEQLGDEDLTVQTDMGTRLFDKDDEERLRLYKGSIDDINEQIQEAEENDDSGKKDDLKETKQGILNEINQLVNSNGELRKYIHIQESPQERARTNVPKNIKNALGALRDVKGGSDLAGFIEKRLHTGNPLSYTREAGDPFWDLTST